MGGIIEVRDLRKRYNEITAVDGVSFSVQQGMLYAFLGPNGAGKSTTIDIICTFLSFDGGTVAIDGYKLGEDDVEIRKRIGVVFQEGVLDEFLTVRENLELRGGFYGKKGQSLRQTISQSAEITNIGDLLDRKYGSLSGGQRRRCDVARALLNTPKLLILDEPTTGLDPQTRKSVWDTILQLQKERKMTVFFTTHYMDEAVIADHILLIDKGKVVEQGTPADLRERFAGDRMYLYCENTGRVTTTLDSVEISYSVQEGKVTVSLDQTMDALPILEQCKSEIIGFEVTSGSMDDVFINVTGKELRE